MLFIFRITCFILFDFIISHIQYINVYYVYMRSTKRRNSKKNSTRRGGGNCVSSALTKSLDKALIGYWGSSGKWRLSTKYKHDEMMSVKIGRREEHVVEHHPIILNLLEQYKQFSLDKALQFYCSKRTNIGEPEYKELLVRFHNLNTLRFHSNFLAQFINDIGREWYSNGNVLQPQKWQLFFLHFYVDDPLYREMNSLQKSTLSRDQKWKIYLNIFTGDNAIVDVFQLGSGHDQDLDERAGIIAERCVRNEKFTSLHTMDGHGRFLCYFLKHIYYRQPSFFKKREFEIYLYDVDEDTHEWHRTTLPKGSAINGDIFEILSDSIAENTIQNSLFYLNLSGIQGQSEHIKTTYHVLNEMRLLDHLVVSFATVRGAKKYADDLYKSLANFSYLTKRKDFMTLGTSIGNDYSTYKKSWSNSK